VLSTGRPYLHISAEELSRFRWSAAQVCHYQLFSRGLNRTASTRRRLDSVWGVQVSYSRSPWLPGLRDTESYGLPVNRLIMSASIGQASLIGRGGPAANRLSPNQEVTEGIWGCGHFIHALHSNYDRFCSRSPPILEKDLTFLAR